MNVGYLDIRIEYAPLEPGGEPEYLAYSVAPECAFDFVTPPGREIRRVTIGAFSTPDLAHEGSMPG